MIEHLSIKQLEEGLPFIQQSPKDSGRLDLIVRRPAIEEREVISHGRLGLASGLEGDKGDNWLARGSTSTSDGSSNLEAQLTLMNSRVIQLLTQDAERWQLAGDQLYMDLDLSEENLPAGTRLSIGSAIIEVTSKPHTGCKKFSERFGLDALKFISAPENNQLRLRGINAKVIQAGEFKMGDMIRKV